MSRLHRLPALVLALAMLFSIAACSRETGPKITTQKEILDLLSQQEAWSEERGQTLSNDILEHEYEGTICIEVYNNTTEHDIKDAVIAITFWDESNLPVKVKIDGAKNEDYICEVSIPGVNAPRGGDNKVFIDYVSPADTSLVRTIVVSYTAFDGTTWENPLYGSWKKIFNGKRMPIP